MALTMQQAEATGDFGALRPAFKPMLVLGGGS